MKTPILLIAVLGYTCASPNGYYHTEYNYKTSQSSFRNNELEHKTDDQGYYKKDGDLENRYKPIEDSNSEHSEYVNPKFQNAGYDYNRDTNSYGHMRAGAYGSANNQEVEDLAHSNRIYGSQSGYGAASGSSYGSYSMGSSLRTVTARLQQQLEREIQDMIRYNLQSHSRLDLAQLERELRQNLTDRLDNELNVKYGQQLIRSGKSYSMIGGRVEPTANYDHQELVDLKNQLENALLSQLRSQYNQYSTSQYSYTNTNTNTNANNYAYTYTTTQRPYYSTVSYRPIYPTLSTPRYVDYTHNGYNSVKTRYTPIANPESLTVIASRVQSQLDANLNNVLDETRRTHFSSSQQYSLTNPEILLERLRTELRNNITYQLDDIIRQNYGSQTQKDGYLYSVGPSGALSSDSNYSLRDLESLKEQIERNLVNKLNRDFESFSKSWSSSSSYRSQSSYGTNYGTGTGTYGTGTGTYGTGTGTGTYGTSAGIGTYGTGTGTGTYGAGTYGTGTLGIGTSNYGTTSNPTYYQPGIKTNEYGSSASAHNTYVAQSSGNMAELQRQLQADLSRQLNLAVNRESAGSYTYNPQTYQTSLQELSNQLNRNLTRHLQEYSASGSYAAQGNFNSAQMADLRTKLEQNLMSQLREGLERSMHSHSSYSSSSSSSSLGNYRNGYESGGCCQGDDPTVYRRFKRSYGHFDQELGQEQEDLGQQQIEETEWTPWERDSHISEPKHTPQRTYHTVTHNTQQKPLHISWRSRNHNYGSPYLSRSKWQVDQSQEETGQQQEQIEYVNMGEQVEDNGYHRTTHGKLQLGSLQQQQEDLGQQQLEDFDYSPQVQVNRYHKVTHGKIISNVDQEQQDLGQQQEEVDYIPQVQVNRYHKVSHGKLLSNPDQEQQDLGQQQEVDELSYPPQEQVNRYHKVTHGKIISNADQEQQVFGQQQDEDELGYTSQVQVNRYQKVSHGKLLSNPDQEQQDLGQQQEVDELSYAPQKQVNRYHKVTHGKIISNADQEQDLGQQQEEDESGYPSQVQVSRYHKVSHGKLLSNPDQEQQDLGQQQEVDELSYPPQEQVNRYQKVTRSKIISNDDQEQQDLGQQQEEDESGYPSQVQVSRYHKVSHGNLLSNPDQEQQDLGQQQEVDELSYPPQEQVNRYYKISHGKIISNADQEQDLGQQQEEDESGYPSQVQVIRYHKVSHGKLLSNADQEQQDLGQQQEEDESGYPSQVQVSRYHKVSHGKLLSNPDQEQQDLGQQQEVGELSYTPQEQVNRYHKVTRGKIISNVDQEQQDLGQQQEEDELGYPSRVQVNGYHKVTRGKLQRNNVDSQQQENLGQQQEEDELGHAPQVNSYHKFTRGKLQLNNVDSQQQQDLSQQQQVVEDLGQQVEEIRLHKIPGGSLQHVDNDDMGQQVEETLISKNNHGILHNTDQEQQNLGQKQVGDIDLDQQQVEEIGFHKATQGKLQPVHQREEDLGQQPEAIDQKQTSIWDETPHINLGIQKKPIDIGQQYVNQYPVPNELADSKIEQVPDTGVDLTQQVEEVDLNAVMGANDLPDDISKKTESIQQSLSKKLEIAIIGFCGTDKLNVAHMREKLTEEIKKNVTEEFNKEETKDYLEHDLHLNSGQILKFQTLILEKLFAKLEAGIEFAKRRHEEQTTSNVGVINEPELSDFTTTEETQQPDISTVLQNDTEGNTVFTQTTRNRTVIISHTQHSNSKVGVTDQGQFITIPQTKVEAENEADSLISILRSYIQKEVERNDVPLKTAVKTFVTNNTDDNGGKHYTRTTIYRGGNENIGQSYTRTVSTSSYSSTGSKPLHDGYQGSTQQQEFIGGSILHRNPQTQQSHYGHVDFDSDILPHQDSIYSETQLNVSPQYSGYNKKLEETFSNPLEHHHNYGSYGKHQQETDWHKITGENLHHSFHLGQQDEIGGFQRPTTHSLHQVIIASNLGQEQVEETGFPKLTHGKIHSNFGQHVDDFQQQDLGQQQQQDLGFGLEQVDRKIKFGQEQVEEPDLVQQQVEVSVLPKFTNGKLHHGYQQNEDLDQQQQEQIEESISHKLTQGKLGYQKQQHIGQQEVVDPDFEQVREIVYNKGSQGKLEVIPVQHQQEIEQVPQVLTDDLNSHNVHVDDEVKDPKTNVEHLTFWQKVTQTVHNGADVIKQQATVLKQKAKDLKEKVHDGTDLIKQKAKDLKEKVHDGTDLIKQKAKELKEKVIG